MKRTAQQGLGMYWLFHVWVVGEIPNESSINMITMVFLTELIPVSLEHECLCFFVLRSTEWTGLHDSHAALSVNLSQAQRSRVEVCVMSSVMKDSDLVVVVQTQLEQAALG